MSIVDWGVVAAFVPAVAVIVTLVIFVVESRRRRADESARLKREAISRLLDSMELSIRKNQGLLASLRFWESPDIGYALAVPRLIHDLGPEDDLVSAWAMSQVQIMIAATSDKRATAIGTNMAMKIVSWGQGKVPDEWFAAELREHPVDTKFEVPNSARLERGWHRLKAASVAEFALLAMMAGSIQIVRQLPEVSGEANQLIGQLVRKCLRRRVTTNG